MFLYIAVERFLNQMCLPEKITEYNGDQHAKGDHVDNPSRFFSDAEKVLHKEPVQ
jgi:hypothetical protein